MRRFFFGALLALIVLGSEALAQNPTNRFDRDIAAFVASDKTNPPSKGGILFIGSSSIRLWKTLEEDFPDRQVLNRGFGGSELSDSIHFFDKIVLPYEPKTIVMYAGANDVNSGKSPERVLSDFKQFAKMVHEKLPETKIAFIAIAGNPARWKQIEQVRKANRLVRAFTETDPRLSYINVHDPMLGPDGQPKPNIFVEDRLHMNAEGYKIWKRVIGEHLRKIESGKR